MYGKVPHLILHSPILYSASPGNKVGGGRSWKCVERFLIPWVMSHLCVGLLSISVLRISPQDWVHANHSFLFLGNLLCSSRSFSLPPPTCALLCGCMHSHVFPCTHLDAAVVYINVYWVKSKRVSLGYQPFHFLDKALRHNMWVFPDWECSWKGTLVFLWLWWAVLKPLILSTLFMCVLSCVSLGLGCSMLGFNMCQHDFPSHSCGSITSQ